MHKLLLSTAVVGAAAWAFQSGIAAIGVDSARLERAVSSATRGDSLTYPAALIGRAAVEKVKAMSPEARAAVVAEGLRAAKALVSTPAFAQAHDAYLAKDRNAVNHGIVAKTDITKKIEADPTAGMKDIMAVAAVQMGESFRKMDKTALKMLLDMDMENADASLKKIAPLLESNLPEFQKKYSLWKSAQMGGPSTEEAYQAALNTGSTMNAQEQKVRQQRAWDENNLKAVLRKRLDEFIATASTVDFAAATRQDGGTTRFVNPAYERKSAEWKLMYRAGRAPVQTALEFARVWRKEL